MDSLETHQTLFAPETANNAEQVDNSEKFKRCSRASQEISEGIITNLKKHDVNERYHQGASVFFNKEMLNINDDATLEEALERARALGKDVVVYSGGINWRGGDYIHPTELVTPDNKLLGKITSLSQELSSDLSHDLTIPGAKKEEEKPSALNFLADADKAVVITIDPAYREDEVIASSLRSDAIAKKTILDLIHNSGTHAEMLNWSDGGFKDIQIQFAGYLAIVKDIRYGLENGILMSADIENLEQSFSVDDVDHENALKGFASILLKIQRIRGNIQSLDYTPPEKAHIKQHLRTPIFLSGYEALNYFESLGNVDNIRGGAPSTPDDLAFPFKSTDKNLLVRGPLRNLTNDLVGLFGKNESNQLLEAILYNVLPKRSVDQQGNALVVFRLLELGRGIKESQEINYNELICRLTSKALSQIKGSAVDVTLGDTSGDVVNSAPESYGTPAISRLLYGPKKSLYIETRDIRPEEKPSIHIEIKRSLIEIERLVAAHKLGLITDEADNSTTARYVPVTLEEIERHPNGSTLHRARKLDLFRLQEPKEVTPEIRELMAKVAPLYAKE